MSLIPSIQPGDWDQVDRNFKKLVKFHIGPDATPTYTGLTLSGLTQGSVVFAGASGVISQDNSNLFWDDTINRLGVGVNSGFDSRMGLTISGDVDILHTATETDDHAFELDIDAAGYGDVKAIDIVYVSGDIGAGEDEEAILVNVDESDSDGGGAIAALEVLTTAVGDATIFGLEVGINVIPIEQLSGTFGNMAKAENDGVNALTEFTTSDPGDTNNIEIFVANGDTVLIGNTAKFEEIEFIFETFSNPSVKPTFEFSTGGTSFSSFTPADGTNGMRNNGVVLWLDSDIPSWATNTGGNYEIRITRTKGGNLASTPKEDLIQIGTATEYVWNKDGDVNINNLTLAGNIELGHASDTTITRASAGNLNIEGNLVYRTGGTDVPIADGGSGQSTAQLAINALSAISGGTNEYVLTKDTGTGNALWKPAGAGDEYIDRGDPASDDWTTGNFTTDGTWRDLDCSSIVPAGAACILFTVVIQDDLVSQYFALRKNGNSNTYATNFIRTQVSNIAVDGVFTVACDSNRVVEYFASNTTFTTIFLTVLGWWLPAGTTNGKVKVDSGAAADYIGAASNDGVLRTGAGLSYADGGNYITLTADVGIADNKIMQVNDADAADDDYAKFTATGLEGRSYSEVLGDLSGQAGATFAWNSQNLTGVGTIGCGIVTGTGAATFEGASVTVGKASTTTGTLVLHDSNSANTITLTVPDISAGSLSFTLPPTDGANTNVLQTDGNGVLTWVAAGGAGADVKVGVDVGATADYLGAANNDGALRTDGSNITYTDGGNFVTLTTAQGIQTSSTPQFTRLGLGIAAHASVPFHVSLDGNAINAALLSEDATILSKQAASAGSSIFVASDVSAHRGVFKAVKSKGTLGTPTVPVTNDYVFSLLGSIYDGVNTEGTAGVDFFVDGNVSENVCPQRISFSTSETNAASRLERLTIKSTGCIGINTTTAPHGGVGSARLAIDGPVSSAGQTHATAGPHVQFTVHTDSYPVLQILNYAHDSVWLNFDSYYDGGWKSSDAGSSFAIVKNSDALRFKWDVAAAGGAITWNDGIIMNNAGAVVIGGTLGVVGLINTDEHYEVDDVQVVGNQQAHIADATTQDLTGTDTVNQTNLESDLAGIVSDINSILAALETHGLLAGA